MNYCPQWQELEIRDTPYTGVPFIVSSGMAAVTDDAGSLYVKIAILSDMLEETPV